jgi:ribosome-associated toxin RatA of RatAB toxin-antitoxin module
MFLCATLAALAFSAPAQARKVVLGDITKRVDLGSLVPLLKNGEVSLVESYANGELKEVTVFGLVNAPQAKVWAVLTDYGHYPEFMPNVASLEVVSKDGDDAVLAYELEVPGSNLSYRLRHHHLPAQFRLEVSLADDEGDIETGAWRWDLVPYAGGAQTIVVYTLYTDVRESSWIIRQVLKDQPSMEHGLNVSTGLISVGAIKKKAEK